MSTSPRQKTEEDLLRALAGADVLETFRRLPPSEQERFTSWIAKAHDDDAHWRRIDILVLAMRMAPPASVVDESPRLTPDAFG